jgi:hypothetical protein
MKLHVAEWNFHVVFTSSVQNEIVMKKPCLFQGYILDTAKTLLSTTCVNKIS